MKLPFAIATFVLLFLFLFEPFEFGQLPPGRRLYVSTLNATLGFLISVGIISSWDRLVTRSPDASQRWRKEIPAVLLLLLAIASGLTVLALFLGPLPSEELTTTIALTIYLKIQYRVLLIALFPMTAYAFLVRYQGLQKHATELQKINDQLHDSSMPSVLSSRRPRAQIKLIGDGDQEYLELSPDDLLFIAAANNYVEVSFRGDGEPKRRLLRAKLKSVEATCSQSDVHLFRCHRSFLVNLTNLRSISKEASGYWLEFEGVENRVPVARRKTRELLTRLKTVTSDGPTPLRLPLIP